MGSGGQSRRDRVRHRIQRNDALGSVAGKPCHAGEKANTANALSSRDYALSTANVYAAAQPGQSLYSLATSAPPNPIAVFGSPTTYGTPKDPMVGNAIGGIIVFAGGLPLYSKDGKIQGGLGLSGGTSCADHVIAWKIRHQLQQDAVPMGPSPDHNDNMILDFQRRLRERIRSSIVQGRQSKRRCHRAPFQGFPYWTQNSIGSRPFRMHSGDLSVKLRF